MRRSNRGRRDVLWFIQGVTESWGSDGMVVRRGEGGWIVGYRERNEIVNERRFADESAAAEDFLRRLDPESIRIMPKSEQIWNRPS